MTFGSGINGCLGHGNYDDVITVGDNRSISITIISYISH